MTTATLFTDTKQDYAKRFQGAYLRKRVTFGAPTIRQFYKRMFDQLGRNSYFVSVFGRVLLDDSRATEAEAAIYGKLKEVEEECTRMVSAMRQMIDDGGVDMLAEFHRPQDIDAAVIVPAQTRYLRLLQLGDQYLVLVNTLWLEGLLDDSQKSKAELDIKRKLRQITTTARNLRLGLQKRIVSEQTPAAGADKAKAAAIASEDANTTADDKALLDSLPDAQAGEPEELVEAAAA